MSLDFHHPVIKGIVDNCIHKIKPYGFSACGPDTHFIRFYRKFLKGRTSKGVYFKKFSYLRGVYFVKSYFAFAGITIILVTYGSFGEPLSIFDFKIYGAFNVFGQLQNIRLSRHNRKIPTHNVNGRSVFAKAHVFPPKMQFYHALLHKVVK